MNDDEQVLETGRLAEIGLQASSLVHELRQPVFAIKALVQMMVEGAQGDASQERLLLEQVEILEVLLDRYGTSSRKPSGTFSLIDIVNVVEASLGAVKGHRPTVDIEFEALGPACAIPVDPVAVHQITANLVRNALDAATSKVSVKVEGCCIEIRDDGTGIDDAVAERLCQPFVTTKPPGKGTGLGLAVTRSLVESMGGTLGWTSSPDGACFRVVLEETTGGKRRTESD